MALNHSTCATAIVNELTAGQDVTDNVKQSMLNTWTKIMDKMFDQIGRAHV
jgi:hypothetical protein